jgi:hypothetical protein
MEFPMNALARFTPEARPQWPDAPHTLDPDLMHPRAIEMAQAMREGATRYNELAGAGFSPQEISRFAADARSLARTLSTRQVDPGGDLLSEMVDKAKAAAHWQMPLPRGTSETQALALAWAAYCKAMAAHVMDPWPTQRERCVALLEGFFARTNAGPAVTRHVVTAITETLARVH